MSLANPIGIFTQAGAAVPLPIVRLGSWVIKNNSVGTHSGDSQAITIPADADLLLAIILIGGDGTAGQAVNAIATDQAEPSSGALNIKMAAPSAVLARDSSPGFGIFWLAPTVLGVSHLITYTTVRPMSYSAMFLACFKGVGAIGNAISINSASTGDDQVTKSSTLVTTAFGSIIVGFGAAQGADTGPFVALHGATLAFEGTTGGGSSSLDADYGLSEELVGAPDTYDTGWSWDPLVADAHGIGAVELKRAA